MSMDHRWVLDLADDEVVGLRCMDCGLVVKSPWSAEYILEVMARPCRREGW